MRVTYYTDSTAIGGAELSFARLVAELDGNDVEVVGIDESVVELVAAGRPGCGRTVIRRVRSKWDLPQIAAHTRTLRELEPELLHVNLRNAWSCQYAILAGLLSRSTACVGTLHSILPPDNRRQGLFNRVTLSRLDSLIAVSGTAARAIEFHVGLDPGLIRVIENGVPPPTSERSAPSSPASSRSPSAGWRRRSASTCSSTRSRRPRGSGSSSSATDPIVRCSSAGSPTSASSSGSCSPAGRRTPAPGFAAATCSCSRPSARRRRSSSPRRCSPADRWSSARSRRRSSSSVSRTASSSPPGTPRRWLRCWRALASDSERRDGTRPPGAGASEGSVRARRDGERLRGRLQRGHRARPLGRDPRIG